ncbi:MAG: hypothetical protein WC552_08325 [Candidatus Omnitrophota bacterium]
MKIGIETGVMAIGRRASHQRNARINPFEGEGMSRTSFLVPWHNDQHGDSTELVITSPDGASFCSLFSQLRNRGEYRSWGEGEWEVEILPGSMVHACTTCSSIEGRVLGVKNPFIYLGDVIYDGPWTNFAGGTCLTFGQVKYPHLTGDEPVIATCFRGNYQDYKLLREREEAEREAQRVALGDPYPEQWGWEETFSRRKKK